MTYSLEETKALLDAQVAKKGADYVYPRAGKAKFDDGSSCLYFEGDTPSCIVGHVFADIGLGPDDVVETGFDDEPEEILGLFDERAQKLLLFTQMEQDMGETWGSAVNGTYAQLDKLIGDYESEA